MRARIRYALLLLGFLLVWTQTGLAHESRPIFLGLDQQDGDLWRVTWKRPMRGDAVIDLVPLLPAGCNTSGETVALQQDGASVEIWSMTCPDGLDGATLAVDGLQGTLTDVLVRIAHANGQVQIARLGPATPAMLVTASVGTLSVATTYAGLGIKHIVLGYDHLLFVVLLVLISGTPRRILWSVTGFTLAHSVTLALATLDVIRVPVSLVEALIALSIAALAAEVVLHDRRSLAWRYPALVSSGFGLLHGLGFASALRETGIPPHEVPVSLLFFNVGVEIGQVAFVAVLLAGFLLCRRLWSRQASGGAIVPAPSAALTYGMVYPIGALAGYWCIERTVSFL